MPNGSGPMACPVDGATLVMSERSGIEIDYCPTCRGVWLDRGELDKIIERNAEASAPPVHAAPQPQHDRRPSISSRRRGASSATRAAMMATGSDRPSAARASSRNCSTRAGTSAVFTARRGVIVQPDSLGGLV